MIHFKTLKLHGFKSFVDRTVLDIEPGLTGIVGPNGCGKSNLVEALRWVMGETSAKKMRGDGMEDVIFAGTSARPARTLAEVSIVLDNQDRDAPPACNGGDEIEISRKIERDRGSAFRINGRIARARDVQMLFADAMSGANSPALVSQGRVTAIINARPADRRLILEESAGISGLYARRHEAELRLRAADQNLARLEDLTGGMDQRLASLRKQARQAARYKSLSARIRQADLMIAWSEWRVLHDRIREAEQLFADAEKEVAAYMAAVAALTKTQTTQGQDLPALRQEESREAAALQAKKIELQRIEDRAAQSRQALEDTQAALAQTGADIAHETRSLEDSETGLTRLTEEAGHLEKSRTDAQTRLKEKESEKADLAKNVEDLESRYTALMQSAAQMRASRDTLVARVNGAQRQLETLHGKETRLSDSLAALKSARTNAGAKDPDALRAEISKTENDLTRAKDDANRLAENRAKLGREIDDAKTAGQKAANARDRQTMEIKTLRDILEAEDTGGFRPVVEDIRANEGFEAALTRALGEAVAASFEDGAPMNWRKPDIAPNALPPLPEGLRPVDTLVEKPPAQILPLLKMTGLAATADDAERLAPHLLPGQSVVTKDGGLWRWDGFHAAPGKTDRHALRLRQKNRLAELESGLPALERDVQSRESALAALEAKRAQTRTAAEETSANIQSLETSLRQLNRDLQSEIESRARQDAGIARQDESLTLCREEIARLETDLKDAQDLLDQSDAQALKSLEDKTAALREKLAQARAALQDCLRDVDRMAQAEKTREARLHAIADERVNLKNRSIRARERLKTLDERQDALREKLNGLKARPDEMSGLREDLLSGIQEAEYKRNIAADKLAALEAGIAETARAMKETEARLADSREARARAQATWEALRTQNEDLDAAISGRFEMSPAELKAHITLPEEALEDIDAAALSEYRQARDELARQRDALGSVNLRADEEATELERELAALLHERNDLISAIEELRGGINKLNKEARERLRAAFDHVNAHFARLFTQLFGGGKAHLALIDSDDPLGAGLEIFAQPPGKSLQSLSLLSGGEQTLAAIALIFGMFLTNPSPVCVLDEIDAPLDDANVDRVCDLLEEICETVRTRFLLITHHRLTMARMDRLYGVTMAERGISQLVSVDLQKSFEFAEAA